MKAACALGFTKWDGTEHWSCSAIRLGRDEFGLWLGLRTGTRWSRPGADVTWDWPAVFLIPPAPYVARFLDIAPTGDRPDPTAVYVDVTTVPVATDRVVTAVDLDLDVIRSRRGEVFVDDEDEFEDNRVKLGYPDELAATARATADDLVVQLTQHVEPFGTTAESWLARVR